jgi:prophage regulatory protein
MFAMLRRPGLCAATGKSMSSNYRDIADGLLTEPIPIGVRAVAWPDFEIDEINCARLRGKSNDEIRLLVARLMQARMSPANQIDEAVV